MKKYALALTFTLFAYNLFAVDMPSITSNTTTDGSANPVNNSTSMGDEGGMPIKGNSPVVIDNRSTKAPYVTDETPTPTPGTLVVRAHHHSAGDTGTAPANPPGDENPMGAGR